MATMPSDEDEGSSRNEVQWADGGNDDENNDFVHMEMDDARNL